MFDPYKWDTPSVSDPANNLVALTKSDTDDLVLGVKALRIWNPDATPSTITVTTVIGETVTITVPPTSLTIEPLRVSRVWATGTTATAVIHGYTDRATPA